MGLSKKFPRKILYAKKAALRIGLIKPSTTVQIQAIKLYIGNKRAENDISKILIAHEEMIMIEKGQNQELETIEIHKEMAISI